jgi:hypothetical protein
VVGYTHSGWGEITREVAYFRDAAVRQHRSERIIVTVTRGLTDDLGGDTPYPWELNVWYQPNAGITRISGETDCIYGERGLGRSYVRNR